MEFALCVPLFVFVMWSLVTIVAVARVKMQTAMVAHAVMREAAGGLLDEGRLLDLARGYAQTIGMPESASRTMTVTLGCPWMPDLLGFILGLVFPIPQRVTVTVSAPVPDSLKLLTGPVNITCTNDFIFDTWKDPWKLVLKMFGL